MCTSLTSLFWAKHDNMQKALAMFQLSGSLRGASLWPCGFLMPFNDDNGLFCNICVREWAVQWCLAGMLLGTAPFPLSRTRHVPWEESCKPATACMPASTYGEESLYLLSAKQTKRNVRKAMKSARHI